MQRSESSVEKQTSVLDFGAEHRLQFQTSGRSQTSVPNSAVGLCYNFAGVCGSLVRFFASWVGFGSGFRRSRSNYLTLLIVAKGGKQETFKCCGILTSLGTMWAVTTIKEWSSRKNLSALQFFFSSFSKYWDSSGQVNAYGG